MIKEEDVVILISKLGYIKRIPITLYKQQGRGGKGSASANLVENDYINQLFIASTYDYLMFITNEGKAYWIKVHEIPEAARTSRGSHIKGLLAVSANEEITTIVALKEFSSSNFLFMATAQGTVKKTPITDFANAKTRGIISIKLDDGDKLVSSILTSGKDEIMFVTRRGQTLRVTENDIREMGRSSRGVRGIRLRDGDELTGAIRVEDDKTILVITEKGYGKRIGFDQFHIHGRGTGGQRIFGNTEGKGEIIGILAVSENDEIVCMTSQGKTLRVKASTINKQGAGASGVSVLKIDEPDYLIGIDKVSQENEKE